MKNSKKGISLIVLVITIIVIIILAAAVLLTMSKNNPVDNAKQAVSDNDVAELKSAMALYIANFVANDANHSSPFADTEKVKVSATLEEGSTEPKKAASVGAETIQGNALRFAELGVTSKAVKSFEYDVSTGKFTFVMNTGYATPSNI